MRTVTKATFGIGAVIAAAGIAYKLATAVVPLAEVPYATTPYTHNMTIGPCVYSGPYCVHAHQWGAYAVDVTKAVQPGPNGGLMVSPVTNMSGGYQPAIVSRGNGDFHQIAQQIGASAVTPKWVVTDISSLGSVGQVSPKIPPYKTQVYRLGPGGVSYAGQVFVAQSGGGAPVIVDDTAYFLGDDGIWTPVLLTGIVPPTVDNPDPIGGQVGARVVKVPPHPVQNDVGGYTYTVSVLDSQHFKLLRAGGPPPTTPTLTAVVPPTVTSGPPPLTATSGPPPPTQPGGCNCVCVTVTPKP